MLRAYPAYLVGGFSALALLLATLGLYGVLAYSVAQRSRELGLRMALGAQRGDLLRMVVKSGLKLAVAGIALGVVGGFLAARLIASLLFGVAPTDAGNFRGRLRCTFCGRDDGQLHSGPSRDQGRSHGGAALRVMN